ncbi:hypothetical protein LC724_22150 [Blautia sp. RD014234]|nr:hypothetical protein [Blautia parvula]
MEEDVRQKLHLDCVEVSTGMNMFGFSNSGRKPWVLQSGLAVDVPLNFNTTVDETGRTYLYPQGDLSVPPSGMMPKGDFSLTTLPEEISSLMKTQTVRGWILRMTLLSLQMNSWMN